MTGRWANNEVIASGEIFEALHAGLTVGLIATARGDLMTCEASEALSDVMERNQEPYDFLPVVASGSSDGDRIAGLLHAAPFFDAPTPEGTVKDHFSPLSEEFLIGADTSILAFVKDADSKSCRLVVSGPRIVGLVSLSDLQKLPVRAALFALITGFEITMAEAIKENHATEQEWMALLSDGRQSKIDKEIKASRHDDGYVDSLLFTQFSDKADIIVKSFQLSESRTKLRDQLKEIKELRDDLAHANEYASTPQHAGKVCAVVRNLLALREQIANSCAKHLRGEELEPAQRGVV